MMSANLLDLWRTGSTVNTNLNPPQTKILALKKVKKMNVEFGNSSQFGKKNFPGLNITRRKMECSSLYAANTRQCPIKEAGFTAESKGHPIPFFAAILL